MTNRKGDLGMTKGEEIRERKRELKLAPQMAASMVV